MSDAWANFLVAQVGASAALLGLLFVGVSLNLGKILAMPPLPNRALLAMILLLGVLIGSMLLRVPGQPAWVSGSEILVLALLLWIPGSAIEAIDLQIFGKRAGSRRRRHPADIAKALLFQAATVPYIAAGGLVIASASGADSACNRPC